jgi:transposase-like protein
VRWGLTGVAELVEVAIEETLTYYTSRKSIGGAFAPTIRIRTNNPLERIVREIRRRTRVVGAFPKVRKPALDLSDIVRRTCTAIADAS